MLVLSKHYQEPDALLALVEALETLLSEASSEAIFLCIGSNRHLLDSFGPLTGSMISEKAPTATVFGTLDEPLHGGNLASRLLAIKREHSGKIEIAIDASLGSDEEMGMIKLRRGSILPGKALARRLPPVGSLSLTGVVGSHSDKLRLRSYNPGSLAPVYYLAQLVATAVAECYHKRG